MHQSRRFSIHIRLGGRRLHFRQRNCRKHPRFLVMFRPMGRDERL
jgi:hypothetical protein